MKLKVLATCLIFLFALAGCSANDSPQNASTISSTASNNNDVNPSPITPIEHDEDIILTQIDEWTQQVESRNKDYAYKLEVPSSWNIHKKPGWMMSFIQNGELVGGLDILGYDDTQKIRNLYPNHSGPIMSTPLGDNNSENVLVLMETDHPAASMNTDVMLNYHAYFPVRTQKIAYDLHFEATKVSHERVVQIANSFVRMAKSF